MWRIRSFTLLFFVFAAVAFGAEKPKGHANAISGTVTRIDGAPKTFVVRGASGKETTLVRTSATKINGETLRVGDRVAVRWLERDGKKVATSVRIEPPAVASATPTTTPTPPVATR